MKRINVVDILTVLFFCLPSVTIAAPFLITDPVDTNADQCVYQNGGNAPQTVPVVVENGQKICKIDLAASPSGQNSVTLKVRNTLWGVESATSPFAFTKPTTLVAPGNTRIVP